jgi:CheY-like chemotaxis protein
LKPRRAVSKDSLDPLRAKVAEPEFAEKKSSADSRDRHHEFRSHLHTILGYARLIPSHSQAITPEEIANVITEAALRMQSMVEDGGMRLQAQPGAPVALPAHDIVAQPQSGSNVSSDSLALPVRRRYKGPERTILVAEDTQENIILLSTLLEDMGFRVLIARSGDEAVGMRDQSVDLVVTDQNMQDGNVWDLLRVSMDADPCRPVLLLSGSLPERPKRLPRRYSFTKTLQKPADHRHILKTVGDVLRLEWQDARRQGRRSSDRDEANAASASVAIPPALRAELARLTGLGLITDIGAWANALLLRSTSVPEMAFAEAVIFAADRLDFPALIRLSNT